MREERTFTVEPLDQDDIDLLRFMRRTFSCDHVRGDCPALADCPEGFYVCDAIANMLSPGTVPELGPVARTAVRYLYDQVNCEAASGCPSRERCGEEAYEPCEALMQKLGVVGS
jgi:hypothetical protein